MKIALKMTGCRNNRYELERILRWALDNNVPVVSEEEADFCIINTCTVTHVADKKSRQMIRKTKNGNPKLKTIVFGCAARVQRDAFEQIDEVDILLNDLPTVIRFLEIQQKTSGRAKKKTLKNEGFVEHPRSRAMVQIQDGCDNYCSYCIIAAARGQSRSHPIDQIIHEIRTHEKEGHNEVVLTGINIGGYGASSTLRPQESYFARLLKELLEKTRIARIRISSLGPEYFSEELFDVLRHIRICRHIHLSVQSGSSSVLKRMRRQYDANLVQEVIQRLKSDIPDIAITTDFIVGFPEETDEEFTQTLEFLKRNPIAKAHIFPYSIRDNTLAAKMNQVDDETKKMRAKVLKELTDTQREAFIQSQIGKEIPVLWETTSPENNIVTGITDNYIRVFKKADYPLKSISMEKLEEGNIVWD